MGDNANETKPDKELIDCGVAIVGCGPAGLVAASLLGRAGHRVVVVERWLALYGLPRLSHIDGETARIVQSCGDVDQALRDAIAIDQYDYRDAEGNLLTNLNWKGEQCGFPAHNSIFQPDIEEAIYQRAESFPNVTILRGLEAIELSQDSEGVTIVARPWKKGDWGEGEATTVRAKFLIGADGANSFVRQALGIGRFEYSNENGEKERWLNLDSEYLRDVGGKFDITTVYCDPARAHMYMPIGKSRVRFEVRLLPGETIEHWETLAHSWAWFNEKHGVGPADIKPLRNVVYTFDPAIAYIWQKDRIFLAGDAAHTMMPYMGQGACSGMRDGANLAWKLDLVLRGRCDDALLETYEQERRPHVTQITEMAQFLGKLANEVDPEKVAERNAMFRSGKVPPMPPFPKIEAGIVHRDKDGVLAETTGAPAPQGSVRKGGRTGRLDDLVGGGFMLVCRQDPVPFLDQPVRAFLADLDCKVAVIDDGTASQSVEELSGDQMAFMKLHGMAAYLRRPDFSVFGSVAHMSGLNELLADLRDKLHWRDAQSTCVDDRQRREAAA